ncbi:MAG TPA: hypothetical protein VMZ66_05775 [Aeromicrobium sp.]|nr:hypothetical protein [Aeromicrobium sp.]
MSRLTRDVDVEANDVDVKIRYVQRSLPGQDGADQDDGGLIRDI